MALVFPPLIIVPFIALVVWAWGRGRNSAIAQRCNCGYDRRGLSREADCPECGCNMPTEPARSLGASDKPPRPLRRHTLLRFSRLISTSSVLATASTCFLVIWLKNGSAMVRWLTLSAMGNMPGLKPCWFW
jgi:hypothetical protein